MGISRDEELVRQMLADVTADQPDAPSDRYRRIRDRAAGRGRIKMAAATIVLAALAGIGVGIGTSAGSRPPEVTSRHVPAWALPWPDHRDGSVPQRTLASAVAAWRHHMLDLGLKYSLTAPSKVIWYVGQTAVHGQVVVVIFEVQCSFGKQLVAGWLPASYASRNQPTGAGHLLPWVLYEAASPIPSAGLAIGLNIHGTTSRPGRNPDNWIVVLAAPQVQTASWTEPLIRGSNFTGISDQTAPTSRGLLVADTGQITGRVNLLALTVGRRNMLAHHVWVGVPGNRASQIPQLEKAAPIRLPRGFRQVDALTGQGSITTNLSGTNGRLAVLGRCYGPAPVRLTYGREPTGAKHILGTMACDNAVHEVITNIRIGTHSASAFVTARTSELTAVRLILGTAG